MSERFQEAGCNENGDLVRLEAEIPGGLGRVEAGRGNLPTQKFGLFCKLVHTSFTRRQHTTRRGSAGVAATQSVLDKKAGNRK